MEEVLESSKNNRKFNFYKSLDIDNISAEILALHPSITLDRWLSDPNGQFYKKQTMKVDDVNLQTPTK